MHIRRNILIAGGIFVTALVIFFSFYSKIQHISLKKGFSVSKLDNKGVFVGDASKVFQEKPKKIYQEIDFVWNEVHEANSLKKAGRLAEAAEHYKRAFYGPSNDIEMITPERGMAAFDLIDTYEKLGRYDEALAVLDILDEKFVHGEYGVKKSNEIRSRLITAKATDEK